MSGTENVPAYKLDEIAVGETSVFGCAVPVEADLTANSWALKATFDLEFSVNAKVMTDGTSLPNMMDKLKNADFSEAVSNVNMPDNPMLQAPNPVADGDQNHALCVLNPIKKVTIAPAGDFEVNVTGNVNLDLTIKEGDIDPDTVPPENIIEMSASTRVTGSIEVEMNNDGPDENAPIVINMDLAVRHGPMEATVAGKTYSTETMAANEQIAQRPQEPVEQDMLAPTEKGQKQFYSPEDISQEGPARPGQLSSHFDAAAEGSLVQDVAPKVEQVAAYNNESANDANYNSGGTVQFAPS